MRTSVLAVYTVNGRHDYFGKNAERVYAEIDRCLAADIRWTTPISISTKDGDGTVHFAMAQIVSIAYMEGEETV